MSASGLEKAREIAANVEKAAIERQIKLIELIRDQHLSESPVYKWACDDILAAIREQEKDVLR